MAKPVIAPHQIPLWLKGESSKWIHIELPELRKFAWQDGYGIFSSANRRLPDVIDYIKNQRAHHKRQTFEEEHISLLKLHEIDYDERYVFS